MSTVGAGRMWRETRGLRYAWRMGRGWPVTCAAACAVAALLCACTDDEITVGSQCPKPSSGRATLAADAGEALVYGTSCAPCEGDEARLDARGCPVLVTWASCGGDICIGQLRLPVPPVSDGGPDQDAGDDDAGDDDAGGGP